MRLRRPLLAVVLFVILSSFLAACGSGGSGGSAGGGSTPAGASKVRANVLGFVALDSDLSSDQWQQLDDLARKFPGREQAIAQLRKAIADEGVDYDRDVKPALGPEVDVVIVGGEGEPAVVGLTKPDDPDKFQALVTKLNASDSGDRAVSREAGDGWWAIADSAAAIDRVLKGTGDSLADNADFTAALGKLPDEALLKAYLGGDGLQELMRRSAAQSGSGFDPSTLGLGDLRYAAASVSAEDDGLRVRGAATGGKLGGANFSSKLLADIPADAFALFDFQGEGTTSQLDQLKDNPQLGPVLNQLQSTLGVTLDEVLALLRGEIAFYVRPGAGIPELTLALEEADESSALATLDKLAARIAAATGGQVRSGTQGGHEMKTIDLGRFQIHYGGLGGKVVITSGVNGIAEYGSGDSVADSADFEQAQEAAGMSETNGGFIYVDLKDALPLLEGFAGLAGESLPPEVTENLRPLRSLLAWSEGSGENRTFDAFLEIK